METNTVNPQGNDPQSNDPQRNDPQRNDPQRNDPQTDGVPASPGENLAQRERLSLKQAQGLVKDLMQPNPVIYWTDFLLSILSGHTLFALFATASRWLAPTSMAYWPVCVLLFVGCVIFYARAAMFTHELVHLPKGKFKAFRITWNILCGIPFLVPSFTYYPHLDHHRRKHYGTDADGEYVNLSHRHPIEIVVYLVLTIFTPPVIFFRWLVITPMTWVFPKFRAWIFHHASTMVMDAFYFRPDAGPETHRIRRIQEVACLSSCLAFLSTGWLARGEFYNPMWFKAYLVAVAIIVVNNVRTLGVHRWMSEGAELSFEEQLLDSANYPYRPWATELWGPIGLRYHALHHLFPSLPYHNLGKAHRRLMEGLPPNSIYRETVKVSLWKEIAELWKRASQSRREKLLKA